MRVVVVGGGIAGLSAALTLHDRLPEADITLVEGTNRLGGKLRTGGIDGRVVETGAETFLAREADDPSGGPSAAVRLAERLGLADSLRHPVTTAAGILTNGDLRAIPGGTLMGVPIDVSTMDSAFGPADGADADLGRPVLAPDEDISVGELVRSRVGSGVVDRLVDPLLGGVYAGRADDLSLAVTMPGLARATREQNTLQLSVRAALSRRATTPGPVFATIDGGLTRLIDAMVAAMPSVDVRLGLPVRSIVETGAGTWRLTIGSTTEPETVEADAVVLALPSHPAARLLRGIDDEAATLIDTLDYASIGLVTHVFPAGALDHTGLAGRSGALIPAIEGRLVKAITVFSTKWGEQPDGAVLLRSSIGRFRDEAALRRSDEELATLTYDDLAKIVGVPLVAPLASTVTRWGGALPQYTPGHADRITRARATLPPTIALAGAVADGVGIPLCIRSGETAATHVIQALGE